MNNIEFSPNLEDPIQEYIPHWKRNEVPRYDNLEDFIGAVERMKEHNQKYRVATDLDQVVISELSEEELEIWNEFAQIANETSLDSSGVDIINSWSEYDERENNTTKAFIAFIRNKVMSTEAWLDYMRNEIENN